MAIDNREKRQSVVGINRILAPSPTANASKDQEWRQQSGYGYSGILAANPSGVNLLNYMRGFSRGFSVGSFRGVY